MTRKWKALKRGSFFFFLLLSLISLNSLLIHEAKAVWITTGPDLYVSPSDDAGDVEIDPFGPYYVGEWIELTAIANPGYTFDHWHRNGVNVDPPVENPQVFYDLLDSENFTAVFVAGLGNRKIEIIEYGPGSCNPKGEIYRADGTFLSVYAYPYTDPSQTTTGQIGAFQGWTFQNVSMGNANPFQFYVTENCTLKAYFVYAEYLGPGEEGADNITADVDFSGLPHALGVKFAISDFSGGILASMILGSLFILPTLLFTRNFLAILLIGIPVLGLCTSIGWLPTWLFALLALIIAVLAGEKIAKKI